MRIYLAGPMSGIDGHNFRAFRKAAVRLRLDGYEVVNPAELDEDEGFDAETAPDVKLGTPQYQRFLARDVIRLAAPDISAIVVLPGWERSNGARLEVSVARCLGKPVLAFPEMTHVHGPGEGTVLEEAGRLADGDRTEDYGPPAEDFARTAGMWESLFGWKVEPRDVALAMICVKLSRLRKTPDKRDSIVDIAGYARTYEMTIEREVGH